METDKPQDYDLREIHICSIPLKRIILTFGEPSRILPEWKMSFLFFFSSIFSKTYIWSNISLEFSILHEQSSKVLTLQQPYRQSMHGQARWKTMHVRFPKLTGSSINFIQAFCCSLLINKFTSLRVFATITFCMKLASESVCLLHED